ncbi:MAG: biopolymer transporter ExbD [Candidatus Manganitrophus sp.]|nr:biopolymer transporter ExbD [Candidatus Manganitrophus morganii]MDC4204865.1 biopolymer transporter ExbD [Candidatus Manganitrophus sp.]WDT70468.1 MAG: biopolymer transporter ExbD [Candidatus Manganitrophus sp.]WDT82299.1 MAG: biopolymer transporter ExbD [Candidatus Manganitrophus sp.]
MIRRMKRKKSMVPYINLISLMDIFTILVIFLLFQASNGEEVLSVAKDVILPASTASQPPERALTVTVTPKEILVDGTPVAETAAVLQEKEVVIASLQTRISAEGGKKVTILGDRTIPFALLKKVMVTCTDSGIEQISLAVLSREM